MAPSEPFLFAASLAIGCAALAGLRPVIAARREARAAARAAREGATRSRAELDALRERLRKG
jgi:hypothetical protein